MRKNFYSAFAVGLAFVITSPSLSHAGGPSWKKLGKALESYGRDIDANKNIALRGIGDAVLPGSPYADSLKAREEKRQHDEQMRLANEQQQFEQKQQAAQKEHEQQLAKQQHIHQQAIAKQQQAMAELREERAHELAEAEAKHRHEIEEMEKVIELLSASASAEDKAALEAAWKMVERVKANQGQKSMQGQK